MPVATVAIGVPTYRRPLWLERCLLSLAALKLDRPIRVIVADNDGERREGLAVCERLRENGFPHELTTVSVPERGITANRNMLVATALDDRNIEFLAMIDDDEWADVEWLAELLRVQENFQVDIVGGPVMRVFETAVPDYVADANQPDVSKLNTGRIDFLDATNNVLFRTALFRTKQAPWFDPQFALMGGEDKDLMLGFKMLGKTFAWAGKAVVTEELPHSRCSAKWMIQRAYRTGNTDTIVNLKNRPPEFGWVSETAKIIGALGVAAMNLTVFAWHPARRFEGARLGARVMGKLRALTGGRHEEYKIVHGR